MKRITRQAALFAYVGAIVLLLAYLPGLDERLDSSRLLHALWHVFVFVGAASLVYGLETLRRTARRYRRMTQ